jgi:hypothetical protein
MLGPWVGTRKMPGAKSGAEYPDYIAFRTPGDDGHLLTVVAALEPDNGSRFPWARWYHELALGGDFKKVPGSYIELGLDTAIAKTMIDLIKLGRSLPPDFIVKLPIVD